MARCTEQPELGSRHPNMTEVLLVLVTARRLCQTYIYIYVLFFSTSFVPTLVQVLLVRQDDEI